MLRRIRCFFIKCLRGLRFLKDVSQDRQKAGSDAPQAKKHKLDSHSSSTSASPCQNPSVPKRQRITGPDSISTSPLTSCSTYTPTYNPEDYGYSSLKKEPEKGRDTNKRFEPDSIYIYTDGSVVKDQDQPISAGVGVVFGKNHILNWHKNIPIKGCNEGRAEILAVLFALNRLLHWKRYEGQKVIVRVDRTEVIERLQRLQKNNWPIKLRDQRPDYENVLAVMQYFQKGVRIEWVHGHASDEPGNVQADALARLASGAKYEGPLVTPVAWEERFDTERVFELRKGSFASVWTPKTYCSNGLRSTYYSHYSDDENKMILMGLLQESKPNV